MNIEGTKIKGQIVFIISELIESALGTLYRIVEQFTGKYNVPVFRQNEIHKNSHLILVSQKLMQLNLHVTSARKLFFKIAAESALHSGELKHKHVGLGTDYLLTNLALHDGWCYGFVRWPWT